MRAACKVRISAKLIRARDDRHLWSQAYERDLTDILTLQADVARVIASEIRVSLRPEDDNGSRRPNA
jgi:TolB-like protein